ncbi:ligand-binding sensor domain-containing protein [Chitinophaga sancti]|uniref:Two component regulator propeller n=2 Tax=Chitinophaga sancti TaxID=1004 RepID=A0A1K1R9J7_9BACT|nr:two-component regulator propeller domain-containing protein [Chitinophaga sancti]WQD65523.1 two-component regulator propeller domain-containing protein [Chitinophaga sancti]WQG88854.1 two-component regulator propeller domain-containing protein [Chitinophaga sancti]SFW68914.1 Two component regulator propeller [Chitinophaga sancti]
MRCIHKYAWFLILVFCISCGGTNITNNPINKFNPETKKSKASPAPNSMVRNIKQDRNGNILLASYKGVLLYDGKSFTNLTSEINSPSFLNVLEDRKGLLWLATRDSGVYCYNGQSFQHFTTREGLASNAVAAIYEDKAGSIWFGTRGGASCFDGKSFRNFTTKEGLSNNGINAILEDKTGRIWFGTREEACYYDGGKFTIFKNKDGKAFNNVSAIIEDKKGNIWFGGTIINNRQGNKVFAEQGLWRYDGLSFTQVSQRGAASMFEDKQGNIWTSGAVNPNGVGSWKLSRYDQKTLYDKNPIATEIMSIDKMLCGIMEAGDGSIWFGSIKGVYRYDGKNITDFFAEAIRQYFYEKPEEPC